MSLRMLSFPIDVGGLTRLAVRERLLPSGGDLGDALHAAFANAFGELAPKPFALLPPGTPGGGPAGRLLAYAATPLAGLRDRAAAFADPAFAGPLGLAEAGEKTMPERFAAGVRLGFRVRLRPVARTGRPRGEEPGRARERDLYPGAGEGVEDGRADVYLRWLERWLAERGGARLERASLDAFRLTSLLARDRRPEATRPRSVVGPDATVTGTLCVTDADAFAAALARGVGRHRAFGFGMLLLSPPAR
jgi:CRISPR system Cascade subunit CasE